MHDAGIHGAGQATKGECKVFNQDCQAPSRGS
jgi:hypothetical protein